MAERRRLEELRIDRSETPEESPWQRRLSLLGLSVVLAWAVADGYQTATMNWQSFSQVAFSLTVTPRLLAGGIAYALAMGFLGGIFPAVGAVRTPIVVGLRRV
jgi:putative ABC transport system permease protein